ncbi:MAG: DUF3796 domain-containing protein [Candidatus Methanofastidiosia archaeon]
MKNALWHLGFLSLASLLYFVEGKTAFLWFFGFIPYFALYNLNDEMLEMFVGRATTNAFVYTIFFGVAAVAYIYLTGNTKLFGAAFAALLGGALLVCILSLFYYTQLRSWQ